MEPRPSTLPAHRKTIVIALSTEFGIRVFVKHSSRSRCRRISLGPRSDEESRSARTFALSAASRFSNAAAVDDVPYATKIKWNSADVFRKEQHLLPSSGGIAYFVVHVGVVGAHLANHKISSVNLLMNPINDAMQ